MDEKFLVPSPHTLSPKSIRRACPPRSALGAGSLWTAGPSPSASCEQPRPLGERTPMADLLCLFLWGASQLVTFEAAGKEFSNNGEVSGSTEASDENSHMWCAGSPAQNSLGRAAESVRPLSFGMFSASLGCVTAERTRSSVGWPQMLLSIG